MEWQNKIVGDYIYGMPIYNTLIFLLYRVWVYIQCGQPEAKICLYILYTFTHVFQLSWSVGVVYSVCAKLKVRDNFEECDHDVNIKHNIYIGRSHLAVLPQASYVITVRFQADNWNKYRNMCAKEIGSKMKRKEPIGDDDTIPQELVDKLHHQAITVEDLRVRFEAYCF